MPDQWVSELAAAVRYETIADDAAPQTQRPAGGYLGGLPGEEGTQRPVTARAAGYVVATCYAARSNRTTIVLTPLATPPAGE
jgi:hypothetical protein